MRTRSRWASVAACCALGVSLLAGCASDGSRDDRQGDVIATYKTHTLTSATVTAWTDLEGKNPNNSQGVELVGPDYTACTAAAKNTEEDRVSLRSQCAKRHEDLRAEVLKSLVNDLKVVALADKRSAHYAQHNVDMFVNVEQAKFKSIPGGDDMPKDAVRFRAKAQAARLALDNQAMQNAVKPPTERDLRKFYRTNKEMFATAERRDVQMIVAESRAAANKAHRALKDGSSWSQTYQKFNSGTVISSKDGKLADLTRESLPDGKLRDVGFSLRRMKFSSVIDAPGGHTIIRVTAIKPSVPAPKFNEARDQVLAAIQQQRKVETLRVDQEIREKESGGLIDCHDDSVKPYC